MKRKKVLVHACGSTYRRKKNVWGVSLPYLKGVDCKYCLVNTSSAWLQKLSLNEIGDKIRLAGFKVSDVQEIKIGARNNRGRLVNVSVISSRGTVAIPGDQFRKIIGYGIIKTCEAH